MKASKMQPRWTLIALVLAALLMAACQKPGDIAGQVAGQGDGAPAGGDLAPDFIIPVLGGGSLQLSELRGRPVVLYFWATWCGSCRFDLPIIEDVYRQEGEAGTAFLAVNVGQSVSEVQEFVDEGGYTIPMGLDGNLDIGRAYRVLGFPSTYFIDRDGNIQNLRIGPISEQTFLERIEQIQ